MAFKDLFGFNKNLPSETGINPSERMDYSPIRQVGVPGYSSFGGYLTTTEKDPRLIGSRKYRTYGEMIANTTIIAAGGRYYVNLVSGQKWKFEAANNSSEAQYAADLVESSIENMDRSWISVVRRASMYRFYGFNVHEWTAKKNDDGTIGFLDISSRPQNTIDRWDVDKHGNISGLIQRSPQDGSDIYIPRSRILYLVDDTFDDSPEGMGLFRHMADRAAALRRLEQLEMFGYESDLRGTPIARIPYAEIKEMVDRKEITKEEGMQMVAAMENIVQKHVKADANNGITMDSSNYRDNGENQGVSSAMKWDFKLLEGSDHGLREVSDAIMRINHDIARVMGVEHLLLGQDYGSRSMDESKSSSFAQITNTALGDIGDGVNRDIVKPICALNGISKENVPKAKPEKLQGKDVEKIAEVLEKIARAGAVLSPDDPAINEIRGMMSISKADMNSMNIDAMLSGEEE